MSKLAGKISTRIASIALAVILALIPSLLVLAEGSGTGTITITATTKTVLEIELNPTSWEIGQVGPNTEYKTNPEKTWCTMTNRGNCTVNTYIEGKDAVWVDDPSAYKWELSSIEYNGTQIYVLWCLKVDGSSPLIKKYEDGIGDEFYPSLGMGDENKKQFGLKLLTPQHDYEKGGSKYFYGGGKMETHIIISGVAA